MNRPLESFQHSQGRFSNCWVAPISISPALVNSIFPRLKAVFHLTPFVCRASETLLGAGPLHQPIEIAVWSSHVAVGHRRNICDDLSIRRTMSVCSDAGEPAADATGESFCSWRAPPKTASSQDPQSRRSLRSKSSLLDALGVCDSSQSANSDFIRDAKESLSQWKNHCEFI